MKQFRTTLLFLLVSNLFGCALSQPLDPARMVRLRELIDTGSLHLIRGDLEQAEASFLLAQELESLPETVDGLGCVALLRGEFAQAEARFSWVIQNFPDYAAVYGNAALLLEVQGKNEEARAYYLRALALDPENAVARNNFAVHLSEASEGEELQREALRQLRQALAVNENNTVIKGNISTINERGYESEEGKKYEFEL